MASKVGVLAVNQPLSQPATNFVKRSAADALVRRLIAERIDKYLIRLLPLKEFQPIKAVRTVPPVPQVYIPERLEPVIDRRIGVRVESPSKNVPRHIGFSLAERARSTEIVEAGA